MIHTVQCLLILLFRNLRIIYLIIFKILVKFFHLQFTIFTLTLEFWHKSIHLYISFLTWPNYLYKFQCPSTVNKTMPQFNTPMFLFKTREYFCIFYLLQVPQDPSVLRKNIYFCPSCNSYLPSTEFALSSNSRNVGKCRRCTKIDNDARVRQDYSLYRFLLKQLRKAEELIGDGSKIAFLLQVCKYSF